MRRRAGSVAAHVAGVGVAALFLLPLYWALIASLRAPGLPPAAAVEWWPPRATWQNYFELFRVVPMGRYALNSTIVVAAALPPTLLVASLAGFGISQLDTAWRQRLVTASVALMLLPGMAIWTFRFHVLNALGLVDTLGALIVPAVAGGSPLFVLLFYWAYRHIPAEVFESARLDGAGAWTVWRRMAWPLGRPTTAAVTMLAFALYWGDFTTPVLYIFQPKLYTLPIGLQLLNQMDATNLPLLMAGAMFMAAPVVVLFLLVQAVYLRDLSWAEGRE